MAEGWRGRLGDPASCSREAQLYDCKMGLFCAYMPPALVWRLRGVPPSFKLGLTGKTGELEVIEKGWGDIVTAVTVEDSREKTLELSHRIS